MVDETAFYYDNNRKIFNCLKKLYDENAPIDMTTITTELRNEGILEEIGGVIYLTEVLNTESTAANIDYYLKKGKNRGYSINKFVIEAIVEKIGKTKL